MKFVWKEEKGSCKNNSFEQDAARSVQKGCFSLQFITVVSEFVAVITVEFKERIYMNKYWWKKKEKVRMAGRVFLCEEIVLLGLLVDLKRRFLILECAVEDSLIIVILSESF